jgi:TRAP-type C4-dicarboxylate transport system substrate-binding protein
LKKCWLFGLVFVLVIGVLAGCGGSQQASGEEKQASQSGDTSKSEGKTETLSLKLSHQFPKATADEGDFRGQLAVKFAEEVEKRTNGQVKIEIYPANSLMKEKEQYDAMLQGALDMSVFPLDYAGGKVPQFGATLMPALVKNHKQADNWKDSEVGKKIAEIAEKNGLHILVWVWNAGGIGVKGDPIIAPVDVKPGIKIRAAGSLVEAMLKNQGAGIQSMGSSEIYSAMQTGVLDAAITSASSFDSYKLYEQVESYTSPTQNTFWFMFEPLVISMKTWEKLSSDQQKIFEEVAADLQGFANTASAEDDARVEQVFKEKGVNVVQMDDASYQQWVEVAKPVWEQFAKEVEGGQELIDLAQQVKAE